MVPFFYFLHIAAALRQYYIAGQFIYIWELKNNFFVNSDYKVQKNSKNFNSKKFHKNFF